MYRSIFLCLLFTAFSIRAQSLPDRTQPAPSDPIVAPLPESAQWTITLGTSSDEVSPESAALRIACIKTGEIKKEIITQDGKTLEENWYVGNDRLMPDTFNPETILFLEGGGIKNPDSGQDSLRVAGFAGVDWLSTSNYQGVVTMARRECFYFKDGEREAWIDTQTRFPIAFRTNEEFYRYTYTDPPTKKLTLPPNYGKALVAYRKLADRRRRLEKDAADNKTR